MGRKRFSVGKPISVLLLSLVLISSATPAYASSIEDVFPEEEVKALLQRARDKAAKDLRTVNTSLHPTGKGQILVTTDKAFASFPTGHAAMVYGSERVVESVLTGVVWGKNNWDSSKTEYYGLQVKRTSSAQNARAAEWCVRQIGKPYNFFFNQIEARDKFYCSQLVWAAYKDNFNIDLQTESFGKIIYPYELVESNRTTVIYYHWKGRS